MNEIVTIALVSLVCLGNIAMGYVMGRMARPRRRPIATTWERCPTCTREQIKIAEGYGWRPLRDQWPVYKPRTEPGDQS